MHLIESVFYTCYQRVLEASLHDKEREDRKRRRETLREKKNQSKILQQIAETVEEVDIARGLSEQTLPVEEPVIFFYLNWKRKFQPFHFVPVGKV